MTTPDAAGAAPAPDDDPRFTYGVTADVIDTLRRHGYPVLADDGFAVGTAVFRLLYVDTDVGRRPAGEEGQP